MEQKYSLVTLDRENKSLREEIRDAELNDDYVEIPGLYNKVARNHQERARQTVDAAKRIAERLEKSE